MNKSTPLAPAAPAPSAAPADPPERWYERAGWQATAILVVAFVFYAWGAPRTMFVGDSGELATAAATLGIPHPSGYPLYVLLGFLWTRVVLPGSVAFSLGLFSAACAAGALALLHLLLRRATGSTPAGLFAAALLGVSPSFWGEANIPRVYSLGMLALMAVLLLVERWLRTGRIGWLAAAAFATGLGAANHTVMAPIGLAIGVTALAVDRGLWKRPKDLLLCVGAGLAGLLPYLYLPIRSRQNPRLDWGNPETADAFWAVLSRRDFWHRRYLESAGDLGPILGDWLASLGTELTLAGLALALFGLVRARRFGWPIGLLPAIAAVNVAAVAGHGSRSDIFFWHRYYLPSYAVLAVLAGFGLAALIQWAREGTEARRSLGRWAPGLLVIPLLAGIYHWPSFDRSRFRIADDFARGLLASLPPGAHLAASDDNVLFVLIFLHQVEGLRPDVNLIQQGVGGELPPLRFDPEREPLYFTHHPNWQMAEIEIQPVGLAFRVERAGRRAAVDLSKTSLAGEDDPRVPKDYLTRNLIGHFHAMLGMTCEARDWPRAVTEFAKAAAAAPDNDVLFYNLGLIWQRNGQPDKALASFRRAAEINPRAIPSAKPVKPADQVAALAAEAAAAAALEAQLRSHAGLGDARDAATWQRLAELFDQAGQALWAKGARLRALEAAAAP